EDGRECGVVLVHVSGTAVIARVESWSAPDVELPCRLHVALAVLKGEKLDWAVQKLTELGADRISLMRTERTIVAAREERWPRRLERYRRIAVEAAEQSGRVRVPRVAGLLSLEEAVEAEPEALRVV